VFHLPQRPRETAPPAPASSAENENLAQLVHEVEQLSESELDSLLSKLAEMEGE
jgi:hypothetical protein